MNPIENNGRFGNYGGAYVPEILIPAVEELSNALVTACEDPAFQAKYHALLKDYVGRPTALTFASRLTKELGGPRIYLKREDLCHTGA
ncbi:MAG: tryptophan synthase subunit beta, partial [Bacteroidetes Order II. Incertae sedis bacterium]|nr:tryptophan synthase subunit beta [Bacteroidetes Order II. bacterium]